MLQFKVYPQYKIEKRSIKKNQGKENPQKKHNNIKDTEPNIDTAKPKPKPKPKPKQLNLMAKYYSEIGFNLQQQKILLEFYKSESLYNSIRYLIQEYPHQKTNIVNAVCHKVHNLKDCHDFYTMLTNLSAIDKDKKMTLVANDLFEINHEFDENLPTEVSKTDTLNDPILQQPLENPLHKPKPDPKQQPQDQSEVKLCNTIVDTKGYHSVKIFADSDDLCKEVRSIFWHFPALQMSSKFVIGERGLYAISLQQQDYLDEPRVKLKKTRIKKINC